jgi:uncharacterized protein (TIGR00369 family)
MLSDAELIARMNSKGPPSARLFKQKVLEIDRPNKLVRLSFEPTLELCNPMGTVQGGFVAAMMDDACAIAIICISKQQIVVPTLELKTSFLKPAFPGLLMCEAKVLQLGKSIAFAEAKLFNAEGALLAHTTLTCKPSPVPDRPNFVDLKP